MRNMVSSNPAVSPQAAADEEREPSSDGRNPPGRGFEKVLPVVVLATGFVARLLPAWRFFLNPDEALHNLLASQSSVSMAYKAALTNAHPPLLILVLYYWRWLGQSELILRLPSVLAGTACCWIVYQWLKLVTDRSTAFIGLLLFTFAPSLIGLSAEIRQYALLSFFMASSLYFSERALRQGSLTHMVAFSLSLYAALLTHYSALFFALAIGVYMLVRLYPYGKRLGLFAVWCAGQIGALAISAYFLLTHVVRLRQSGMMEGYETYLRKSIFHAGERNAASFAALQTLRVFTNLFSHGVMGTLALLAFLTGMVLLLLGRLPRNNDGPPPRQLALLLGLPFLANYVAALFRLYPYGGTRHAAFLALFAVSGASIGLAAWLPARPWTRSLAILLALVVCNFFPAPPPLIRARNQSGTRMRGAVQALRDSVPPGSFIVADYESGLLLGYYVCGHGVVQVFPPLQPFSKTECGPYTVVTTNPQRWKFYAGDLPGQLASIAGTYSLVRGSKVWLFYAGWIVDSAPALQGSHVCSSPRSLGENILLCELTIGGSPDSASDRPITELPLGQTTTTWKTAQQ